MVIDIREVRPHDKAEWLQLWEGYTHFYGSPQPEEVTECTAADAGRELTRAGQGRSGE